MCRVSGDCLHRCYSPLMGQPVFASALTWRRRFIAHGLIPLHVWCICCHGGPEVLDWSEAMYMPAVLILEMRVSACADWPLPDRPLLCSTRCGTRAYRQCVQPVEYTLSKQTRLALSCYNASGPALQFITGHSMQNGWPQHPDCSVAFCQSSKRTGLAGWGIATKCRSMTCLQGTQCFNLVMPVIQLCPPSQATSWQMVCSSTLIVAPLTVKATGMLLSMMAAGQGKGLATRRRSMASQL